MGDQEPIQEAEGSALGDVIGLPISSQDFSEEDQVKITLRNTGGGWVVLLLLFNC